MPLAVEPPTPTPFVAAATRPSAGPATAAVSLPTPARLEQIGSLPLRQSLADAAPMVPAPESARPADPSHVPPLTLVGTVGSSLAMFKATTGGDAIEVRAVGESIGGVAVVAIRPSQVDVRPYNGRVVKLDTPPEAGARRQP